MDRTRGTVLAAVTMLALTGCGGGGDDSKKAAEESTSPTPTEPTTTALEDAAAFCGAKKVGNPFLKKKPASNYINVGDEGQTLTISGGDEFSTPKVGFCILGELGAPESTMGKVEGTTAMMGQLDDTFEEYELTWSYHPDNGLNMVIEATS